MVGVVLGMRGMAAMYRAGVKPRRLGERGSEPQAPNRDQGTEPHGTSHEGIILDVFRRFARLAASGNVQNVAL
jgi:hypothetical protein